MKQKKESLQTYLTHAQQPQNPDDRTKFKTQKPERGWQAPDYKEPMLTYTLVSELNPAFTALAARFLGRSSPLITFEHGTLTRINVTQVGDLRRLEALGGGVFGQGFCYLVDPEQGMLYLDTKDRLYLHLGKESSLEKQFKGMQLQTGKPERTKLDDREVTRVAFRISAPVSGEYVLYFLGGSEFDSFAEGVLDLVVGCSEELERQGMDCDKLTQLGIPVRGELYIDRDCNERRLASHFELKSLKLVQYDANQFAIPEGFEDLRDLPRKENHPGGGYTYGKPVRASTVRHRRSSPTRSTNGHNGHRGGPAAGDETGRASAALAHRDEENLKFPSCFPSTYGSQVANLVDQKLLDDLKYVLNGISRRLSSFSGSAGSLPIPWLDQFQAHADSLAGGAGSGLFFLLRDPDGNGQGMLDKLAETEARRLMVAGDPGLLTLPGPLLAAINTVIANPAIAPVDRFDALAPAQQSALREAYLAQRIGRFDLTYPSSTPATTIFHDLLVVRLDNIAFDINIDHASILQSLVFAGDHIDLEIGLPKAAGRAFLSRWPSERYWLITGISTLACFFFPPACVLASLAVSVGLFLLLDFAFVSIDLSNIELDGQIRFIPNAGNVLQPDVSLQLDADITVSYASVVPTGVHQILSLIYSLVGSHTDVVLSQIESQAQDKLNEFLRQDLDITYPPSFGPVPLTAINNAIEFLAADRMYIQTRLNAGLLGVVNPFITQVDSEIKDNLLQMRDEFKAAFRDPVDRFNDPDVSGSLLSWVGVDFDRVARYYLGSVISQNFLNHYVHTLWRQGVFTYEFSITERAELLSWLAAGFPQLGDLNPERIEAALWPAVSPRTVLTPRLESADGRYATTFFDDVRLCIGLPQRNREFTRIEFLFSAQLYTEIGFGGLNRETGRLDIVKVTDRVFDIYFDMEEIGVQLIHPEIQSFVTDAMQIGSAVDYSALDLFSVQETLRLAMEFALGRRSTGSIPRTTGDPINIQRYDIGTPAFKLVTQLVPYRQNMYVGMGTSGVGTAIYQGALDIDAIDRTTALLIRAFIPA